MNILPVILVLSALLPATAMAEQNNFVFGGDAYSAGQNTTIAEPVERDAFMAGNDVTLVVPVGGDAHMAGYTVNANAAIGGDLYAAGFTVNVLGSVAGDITAMGNTVLVNATEAVPGNVRLAGASLVVESDIEGALLVTGRVLTLNAPIAGDVTFYGESITFGPNARVDGNLSIQAASEIVVPASVAPAERVSVQVGRPDDTGEAGRTALNIAWGFFWFAIWAIVIWWLVLFVVGALFIIAAPRLAADLASLAAVRPFRRLGLGVLAFAATLGLVPVTALTLIGLVLLPAVLIYVVLACSLAYLAGVYGLGHRLWTLARPVTSNAQRVLVLGVSLIVSGLLIMVPFLGWAIALLLLVFGFGVVSARIVAGWGGADRLRLAADRENATAAPPPV